MLELNDQPYGLPNTEGFLGHGTFTADIGTVQAEGPIGQPA